MSKYLKNNTKSELFAGASIGLRAKLIPRETTEGAKRRIRPDDWTWLDLNRFANALCSFQIDGNKG